MEMKEECLHGMKQTERFLTRMVLMSDMEVGNTGFLKTAYIHLGLHDNRRILDKEKNGTKLAKHITNHIYENIINIIIEEIYEKNNIDVFNRFIEYYKQKFTGIADAVKNDSDPELFLKYTEGSFCKFGYTRTVLSLLYYLLYGKNEAVKKRIISILEEGSVFSESAELFQDSGKQLETMLKIEDLGSIPSYQKFVSYQRKNLTNFIGIKFGQLEKFVLDYFLSYANTGIGIAEKFKFPYIIKNLQDVLERNGISVAAVIKQDEQKCLDMIGWNFKNLCNSMLFSKYCCLMQQKQKATLSEVIRETSIEDPQVFLISLTSSFYYELLSVWLKKFLEKDCINFSIDCTTEGKREQELLSENYRLKDEIEKMKENLKQKEDAYNKLIREHEKNTKNEIHEYEDQIRSLNRQLEKQKKINCNLQKKIPEPSCYTENLKKDDKTSEDTCRTDMDISIFDGKKILFLGGSPAIVNKLKQKFKTACFRDKKSDSFPDKTDIAVILTNYVSHALINKFRASNKNALIIESKSNNVDKIILQMLKASA